MLDDLGLVHMNGRLYDPVLARVLSADPVNSQPGNPQRYNPYSYVLNNPQRYTDPSGFWPEGQDPNQGEVNLGWLVMGSSSSSYHNYGSPYSTGLYSLDSRALSRLDVFSEYNATHSQGSSRSFSFGGMDSPLSYELGNGWSSFSRDFNSLNFQLRPLVLPSMVRNGCQNQGIGGDTSTHGGKGLLGVGPDRTGGLSLDFSFAARMSRISAAIAASYVPDRDRASYRSGVYAGNLKYNTFGFMASIGKFSGRLIETGSGELVDVKGTASMIGLSVGFNDGTEPVRLHASSPRGLWGKNMDFAVASIQLG